DKVWSCFGADCGSGKGPKPLFATAMGAQDHVITARLPRRELGDVYAVVRVRPGETLLATVQASATKEAKSQAAKYAAAAASKETADSLLEALQRDGHSPLADVLYTPGAVALRPEAAGTVKEIAKLLETHPDLKL